jgi:uncharacterized membrane protein YdjX (TVP38/TMEM64 family)
MKKFDKSFWINAVFVIVITGILIYVSIVYAPEVTGFVSHPKKFAAFILSYGPTGALVFMLFQILQVVVAIIPGEIIQIAGGYVFGTFWGTVYSTVGITAGYLIVFFMVRFFGFRLVKELVSEKYLATYYQLINSPGSEITIFVLFLLPGMPKDILVYICGLTPVKPLQFFIIITIARFPSMLGASYIGANMQRENYAMVIIISVISCVLFVMGFVFKDRIIAKIKKTVYEKNRK